MKISQFDPAIQLTGLESLVVAFNGANYKVSVGDVLAMVTKEYLGLEAVDNTRDMDKPISTATMTALAGKASFSHTHSLTISDIALLDLTLNNKSAVGHSHTEYATVAHSHSEYAPAIHGHSDYAASIHIHAIENVTDLQAALDGKANSIHAHTGYAAEIHSHDAYAPLESPSLTGIPRAPTATAGDSSTQLATTAFVQTAAMLAGAVPDATTTVAGKVMLATSGDTTSTNKAVTPEILNAGLITKAESGHSHADYATFVHGHSIAEVTGLQNTLDSKATSVHSHTMAQILDYVAPVFVNDNTLITAVTADSLVLANTAAGSLLRFTSANAKTLTIDTAGTHVANKLYHVSNRATAGNLTITGAGGMILNPPKGGTLVLEPGDTVSLHVVSATEMDVYGSTLAAV